ncbi:hypothetical protein D3C81_1388120 [compost metagenome]
MGTETSEVHQVPSGAWKGDRASMLSAWLTILASPATCESFSNALTPASTVAKGLPR